MVWEEGIIRFASPRPAFPGSRHENPDPREAEREHPDTADMPICVASESCKKDYPGVAPGIKTCKTG